MTNEDLSPFVFLQKMTKISNQSTNLGAQLITRWILIFILIKIENELNSTIKIPKNFYEITFEKPGGLVMPIIVDYNLMMVLQNLSNILSEYGERMIMKLKRLLQLISK